jgi:hypothetical protein
VNTVNDDDDDDDGDDNLSIVCICRASNTQKNIVLKRQAQKMRGEKEEENAVTFFCESVSHSNIFLLYSAQSSTLSCY